MTDSVTPEQQSAIRFAHDDGQLYAALAEAISAKAVEKFAAAHGLVRLSNSDAHVSVLVGTYYNEIGRKARTDAGLVGALRAGGVECRRDEGRIAALNAVGVRLR